MASGPRDSQHLVFDADDTLWENNVHFERAVEAFLDFLAHSTLSRADARAVLHEIEVANFGAGGYGAAAFARNLRQCYERLAERAIGDDDLATVTAFGERVLAQPLELIDGVAVTLGALGERHDLILMTKGRPEEQQPKVDRSGLRGYFRHVAIVPDKDVATYRALVADLALDPSRTWVIGNSPRSDINPALAAGLNAVHVPHPATWGAEAQAIDRSLGPSRLLVLGRFAELGDHFLGTGAARPAEPVVG